jgi:hypothetical protein
MISLSGLKPELEIPEEAWRALERDDFVNFPAPLLNPPVERDGVLIWSGCELLKLSPTLAAFANDSDAAARMPYGEMFKIVSDVDATRFAQIYAIFFQKTGGEWRMMYRLMNCDRLCNSAARSSCPRGGTYETPEETFSSNWMLSLSGVENWLTLDAYLNYYCRYESYNRDYMAENISLQLDYMEGGRQDLSEARVMPTPNGAILLVSRLIKGWALLFDAIKNVRLARFIMDDPPILVERFWRLHSKIFLSASDRLEMEGMICDARHFSFAIKAAREQRFIEEEVTAAAFYC